MNGESLSNFDLPIVAQIQAHVDRKQAAASAQGGQPAAAPAPPRPALSVVPPVEEENQLAPDPALELEQAAGAEGAPEGEQEPAPEDLIRDIASLADTLGAPPEAVLESVMVPNALGLEVPLGEALETWRKHEESFDARRQELESNYVARTEAAVKKADTAVQQLTGLAKVLIEEMTSDFQGIDFDALRHTNPQEYVRLSEAKMRRRQRIEEVFKACESASAIRNEHAGEAMVARQREEAVKLIRKRPDWAKTPGVMPTIIKENQDVMRHLGFSEQEIAGVTDHRFIIGLHYAAQHLKTLKGVQGKSIPEVKQRRLLRPSVLRQGSRQPAQAPNAEARQARMQQFSQARDVKSAAALIESMLPNQR